MRLIYSLQFELDPTTPGQYLGLIAPLDANGRSPHARPVEAAKRIVDLQAGDWLSHRGTRYQVRSVEPYREHQVEKGFAPVNGFVMAALLVLASVAGALAADRPRDRNDHLPKGAIIDGKVVRISDGDTLTVLDGANVMHKIRLWGIDAPEGGQAFGQRAKQNLSGKVFGQVVRVRVVDHDRYGRTVGKIFLGAREVNAEMVRDGFAWDYRQFDKRHEYAAAEDDARAHRRGLWADPHPVPPWEWRREKRAAREGAQRR